MSKAVKPDYEFNIDRFTKLLLEAKGGRTQTEFARDCGLSVAYVCKYFNRKFDKAPIPTTLRKIAENAANNVQYEDLLDAAGYDVSKYTSGIRKDEDSDKSALPIKCQFEKMAKATIMSALQNSNLKWTSNGNSNNHNFDLVVELKGSQFAYWYFKYITTFPKELPETDQTMFNRLSAYYGQMVFMPVEANSLYSFVTDSPQVFDLLEKQAPTSLAMYISVILIDTMSLSVVKSVTIKTAFPNTMDIPCLS